MRVETRRVGRNLVVRCAGEFDLATAAEFRAAVEGQLAEWENLNTIIVNLGKVTFVDSSGLGAILGRYKQIQQRGGRMVMVEVPPSLQKVLELSGIFKIIPARGSEADALKLA